MVSNGWWHVALTLINSDVDGYWPNIQFFNTFKKLIIVLVLCKGFSVGVVEGTNSVTNYISVLWPITLYKCYCITTGIWLPFGLFFVIAVGLFLIAGGLFFVESSWAFSLVNLVRWKLANVRGFNLKMLTICLGLLKYVLL